MPVNEYLMQHSVKTALRRLADTIAELEERRESDQIPERLYMLVDRALNDAMTVSRGYKAAFDEVGRFTDRGVTLVNGADGIQVFFPRSVPKEQVRELMNWLKHYEPELLDLVP